MMSELATHLHVLCKTYQFPEGEAGMGAARQFMLLLLSFIDSGERRNKWQII